MGAHANPYLKSMFGDFPCRRKNTSTTMHTQKQNDEEHPTSTCSLGTQKGEKHQQHPVRRKTPIAPSKDKSTNSTQNTNSTQKGEKHLQHPVEPERSAPTMQDAVQHPQRASMQQACSSPLSNVPALFCCEGEGVQAVCTDNAQSVISLFGILMVDVTKGQSAAHTHENKCERME